MTTLKDVLDSGVTLTPMMAQYSQIKIQHNDMLILFRMGDFYELFFEDAQLASKILNITLTHRGKIGDFPIPMAGIPHHAASAYIDRITSSGLKAAICEQIEDPKKAKGLVKRAVTQIVSPSMPFDLDKTKPTESYYMAVGYTDGKRYFLILIDFTTGEFQGHICNSSEQFLEKIKILKPKEFLSYMGQWDSLTEIQSYLKNNLVLTMVGQDYFNKKTSEVYIKKLIPFIEKDQLLKKTPEILNAIGPIAFYLCTTQSIDTFFHIQTFKVIDETVHMRVSSQTLKGLEILPRQSDQYKDSLLGFFDKTQSAAGARELKKIFLNPFKDLLLILERQKYVNFLFLENEKLTDLRNLLEQTRDVERIMAKLSTNKITPSDLINLANTLKIFIQIHSEFSKSELKAIFKFEKSQLQILKELAEKIQTTVNDELGASLDKGNLIRQGVHKQRDRLASLSQNSESEIEKLEAEYRHQTGISKLKIRYNNISGYYIEVSKLHCEKLPKNFIRKQTLVNAERFATTKLDEFEKEVIAAKDKLQALERKIIDSIIDEISKDADLVILTSQTLGKLDAIQSMAFVAYQENFCKPEFNTKSRILKVEQSWHPVIRANLKEQFVCHNLTLNNKEFLGLITGPNMAGKTTVMREMAIIQFLSQIGSFVPAQHAQLSICDTIFCRLGASDDILRGQSTFMVEMTETAEIIRHATEKSFIILDEVGRGTSTFDGLSIAWALVEYFVHKTKAFVLFATHYHELIDVVEKLDGAKNLTVETKNNKGQVEFLYNLIERGASQSFGIYVARLAGLPEAILYRSEGLLDDLENKSHSKDKKNKNGSVQLTFLDSEHLPDAKMPTYLKEIEQNLSCLDINNITPMQALKKLEELKSQVLYH